MGCTDDVRGRGFADLRNPGLFAQVLPNFHDALMCGLLPRCTLSWKTQGKFNNKGVDY